jgi:hypothetical protein
MKIMMKSCNERSLILIDEFGGGTEPQIGGAIAEAVLKRFNQKGTFGVITTHYQNLKHFAEDHEGVVNGAMLYDRHLMQASGRQQGDCPRAFRSKSCSPPEFAFRQSTQSEGQMPSDFLDCQ